MDRKLRPPPLPTARAVSSLPFTTIATAATPTSISRASIVSAIACGIRSGVPLCTAGGDQLESVMTPDGAGGAIVAWTDHRGGPAADIYAGRVDALGNLLWTPNGVPVCTDASNQSAPAIASDGVGGVVVASEDSRFGHGSIFAQRLKAANGEWGPPDRPASAMRRRSARSPFCPITPSQPVRGDDQHRDSGSLRVRRLRRRVRRRGTAREHAGNARCGRRVEPNSVRGFVPPMDDRCPAASISIGSPRVVTPATRKMVIAR